MTNKTLADKLKELRKFHNYNQEDIAAVIGVIRQTYSHYETGKRTPSGDILCKLARFYNITMDELIADTVELDPDLYFTSPAPTQRAEEFGEYLSYFNTETNKKKYQFHSVLEKELLYYFEKLSEADKKEIIEFTKIKARK
ncbi:MAG: helix-turn-helix transcriptional regulator [Lachnospiraceae bacterium]|nr:helix-turn-helix transcriptional regulator [Lachnospiraceae bacterium]